jgi:hypothetical protein
MADMTFSCVSAQRHEVGPAVAARLAFPQRAARGGIFYFLLTISYNIFLFSGIF